MGHPVSAQLDETDGSRHVRGVGGPWPVKWVCYGGKLSQTVQICSVSRVSGCLTARGVYMLWEQTPWARWNGFSANSLFFLVLRGRRAWSCSFMYALKIVLAKDFRDLAAFSSGAPHPARVWSSLCWCGPATASVPSASPAPTSPQQRWLRSSRGRFGGRQEGGNCALMFLGSSAQHPLCLAA